MSVHTMIDTLSIEDSLGLFEPLILNDGSDQRGIVRVEGLVGMTVREHVRPRPNRHGVLNTSRNRDSQPIVIVGELYGDTADHAWSAYREVATALAGAVDTDRRLVWTGTHNAPGVTFEQEVRLVSLSAPIEVHEDVFRYQLTLRPNDPRAFGGDPIVTTLPDSGATVPQVIDGTDRTPPTIEFNGPLTGTPTVELIQTGEIIRLTGAVAAGVTVVADVDARRVTVGGVVRNDLYDYAVSTWFEPSPGPKSFRLTGTGGGGNATVSHRAAYI